MQFDAAVLTNVEVSPGYWRMRLMAPQEFLIAAAGQFVMLRIGEGMDPLLRRPLGIFDVGAFTPPGAGHAPHAFFELLYRVVGRGTRMLAARREGERIDVLGPLGKGFTLGSPGEEKLIVGGGVGLAPLYRLAKELVAQNAPHSAPPRLFAGGRSRGDILCLADFEQLGLDCQLATEDGSLGERGLVTGLLLRHLETLAGQATIYACGPSGMLCAVARIAEERGIPCQVSLESTMACGVGACLGCVVPGREHAVERPDYRCVCSEGPVFDVSQLKWGESA